MRNGHNPCIGKGAEDSVGMVSRERSFELEGLRA